MNLFLELNKIIDYIEENLEERIDYKQLAKIIGVNEYTFQKVFSIIAGISCVEYMGTLVPVLFVPQPENKKFLLIYIKFYVNILSYNKY